MSDLISRSDLIHKIRGIVPGSQDVDFIVGLIENQPTAFDTKKVVEQLEKEKNKRLMFEVESNEEYEKQYFNGTRNGLADAIDIVKKGGLA